MIDEISWDILEDKDIEISNRNSIVDAVAGNIKKAIIAGELKPGSKLVERNICATLKVSRTPVREAFRILQAEGYLTHKPRHGVVVTELDVQELEEIYEVRSNLEQLMVSKVANYISQDQLTYLDKLVSQLESLDPISENDFFRLDELVHNCLTQNCGNEKLKTIIENLKNSTFVIKFRAGFSEQRAKASIGEHRAMTEAIKKRDSELAKTYMKVHFVEAVKFFKERLGFN